MTGAQFLALAGNLFLCHHIQTGSGAHSTSHPGGTVGSFPGVWPGHEADHLPPSSTEVRNMWSYTLTPPICLHGMVLSQVQDTSSWYGTWSLPYPNTDKIHNH